MTQKTISRKSVSQNELADKQSVLPPLLTATQVHKTLQVSLPSLYRMARQGLIPSVRLGRGMIRFPKEAIVRWLDDLQKRNCRDDATNS